MKRTALGILAVSVIVAVFLSLRGVKQDYNDNVSHVVCSNYSIRRMCTFRNLLYIPQSNDFVFLFSDMSVLLGLSFEELSTTSFDLSSVQNHTGLQFRISVVSASSFNFDTVEHIESRNVLLFSRFNPQNIMHVLHDDIIPGYGTLEVLCGGNVLECRMETAALFVDDHEPNKGSYGEFYDWLFLAGTTHWSNIEQVTVFRKVYVGLIADSTWYQYGYYRPQSPLPENIPAAKSIVGRFRANFLSSFSSIARSYNNNNCSCVLLLRKYNRKVLNVDEVVSTIERMTNSCVRVWYMQKSDRVLDLIMMIARARLLIGMHGSGLALATFMDQNSALLELFPYALDPNNYQPYRTLATIRDMHYATWVNRFPNATVVHPDAGVGQGGILHLPSEEQRRIRENRLVEPHLCCENPEWLYRIYQDTTIELNSFESTLGLLWNKTLIRRIATTDYSNEKLKLWPGLVRNISCDSNTFTVKWFLPWNVESTISGSTNVSVRYRVVVQRLSASMDERGYGAEVSEQFYELGRNEKLNRFYREVLDQNEVTHDAKKGSEHYADILAYKVWIQCVVDYGKDEIRIGAFNTFPVLCHRG